MKKFQRAFLYLLLGAVVAISPPFLSTKVAYAYDNLLASTNIWLADNFFKTGRPWADVRAFGAVGNASTDDTTPIQNAINTCAAFGGGCTVYFPPGNYCTFTGVTMTGSAEIIQGTNAYIQPCNHNTITTVSMNGPYEEIKDMEIQGPVISGGNPPTGDALNLDAGCIECKVERVYVLNGAYAIFDEGVDSYIAYSQAIDAYGGALLLVRNANVYLIRDKFDQSWPVSIPSGITPGAWAANHSYGSVGTVVSTGGYYIQLETAGTSGASAPTVLSYGTNITDGTAVWLLVGQTMLYGEQFDTGTSSSYEWGNDHSGALYAGVGITNTQSGAVPNGIEIDDGDFGQNLLAGIYAQYGAGLIVHGGVFGTNAEASSPAIDIASTWSGDSSISNILSIGIPYGIAVEGGSNTVITGNQIYGSGITGIDIGASSTNVNVIGNIAGSSTTWGVNVVGITSHNGATNCQVFGNITAGATTGFTNGASCTTSGNH